MNLPDLKSDYTAIVRPIRRGVIEFSHAPTVPRLFGSRTQGTH